MENTFCIVLFLVKTNKRRGRGRMKIYVQSFSWSKELFGSTMIIFCFICFHIEKGAKVGTPYIYQREKNPLIPLNP